MVELFSPRCKKIVRVIDPRKLGKLSVGNALVDRNGEPQELRDTAVKSSHSKVPFLTLKSRC